MNFLSTVKGSLLEDFFPRGWDMERIDWCCSQAPEKVLVPEAYWHEDFKPVLCSDVNAFNAKMGHEIASEIKNAQEQGIELALILPAGPMGMYEWAVYFLREWKIKCDHVSGFNMDEWCDSDGNTLSSDNPASFEYAMTKAFYGPLGEYTVPESQRNFATKDNLPLYAEKIAAIRSRGGRLVTAYGIGRAFHIAFWEPHFASEFSGFEDWSKETHRVAAVLHPLTIEQNALTSFKSRTTLVPCRANTVGPGLFLQSDYMIGGCDGVFGRGMSWQAMSVCVTLKYSPDIWVTSSYIPTKPGKLFLLEELIANMEPEVN